MEAVKERWTDDRMDDLNHKVDVLADRTDDGFRELRAEMNERFDKVDARLEKVDARFETMDGHLDAMQRTMVHGFVAMTAAIVAGFGGMAGLIATQL
jgi:hypothetical protein